MKKQITLLSLLLAYTGIFAQVPKKIIVEHFTNTRCSICASLNPGFYNTLNNYPNVLHLAIHPSSPYSNCLLSQQTNPDSDARTNYYDVYGGTPRFILQGNAVSNSAIVNSDLYAPLQGQTSAVELKIKQYKFGTSSITSTITIKAAANNSLGNLKLFGALAEDTLFYSSPNGEDQHYDVFRKSLWTPEGIVVSIPPTAGDSVVYTINTPANPNWNFNRIYTVALLQDIDNNTVEQAEYVPANQQDTDLATGIDDVNAIPALIYPNPTTGLLNIQLADAQETSLVITAVDGKTVANTLFNQQTTINLTGLPAGLYCITLYNGNARYNQNIIVE